MLGKIAKTIFGSANDRFVKKQYKLVQKINALEADISKLSDEELKNKTEEFRGGGMDAPIDIDLGMEKMECQFTLVDFDAELMKLFGLVDGNAVQVTLRGALCDDNSVTPMVISLRGMYKELDFGKFKAGDKGTLSASVSCRYYKLNINNSDVIEIDVDNMIRKINGTDVMSEIRDALGI